MNINSLKLVYFSPTRTSQTIAQSIADGISIDNVEHFDMTLPDSDTTEVLFSDKDFVLFATPVYAGRIPAEAVARLKRFKGSHTSAAIVVVYGNRAYEDALLELKNIAVDSGFIPIAAGTFIGEHSFSEKECPIAEGRPGKEDITEAEKFGRKISTKLQENDNITSTKTIEVPGNYPYKEGMQPSKAAASTNDAACTMCESCATVCPTGAISYQDTVITDNDACILCCACIKNCPARARELAVPPLQEKARFLSDNFKEAKKAEVFI